MIDRIAPTRRPDQPVRGYQRWRSLLFLHWQVPADLLRRRPDVRAAERAVAAQSAQIGVAAADLFPSFTLIGSIGVQSENFSDLFRQSSTTGVIGAPSVSWNVLNYGRIRNNIRVQDARFQQLVTQYENAVLNASRSMSSCRSEMPMRP